MTITIGTKISNPVSKGWQIFPESGHLEETWATRRLKNGEGLVDSDTEDAWWGIYKDAEGNLHEMKKEKD